MSKEPLVFGDPNAPLTVAAFIRWLEERFIPHDQHDREQARKLQEINVACLGNGDPEHGMFYKVNRMWEMSQRIEHVFSTGKLLWAGALSVLVAVAAVASIVKSVGLL